ncbi:MAG: hypothetical protein R6W89_02090, partial [Candidatus Hydrogenedentota bacterium]
MNSRTVNSMIVTVSLFALLAAVSVNVEASDIAYIHGDVAADGSVPSGDDDPFHQMLLDDTGSEGVSVFRDIVQNEGYEISQVYDQETTLEPEFLA